MSDGRENGASGTHLPTLAPGGRRGVGSSANEPGLVAERPEGANLAGARLAEREPSLALEPEAYFINVYAARRNGAVDASSLFETEDEAREDAERPSADFQYLYTLSVARTANPKLRNVCAVDLREPA